MEVAEEPKNQRTTLQRGSDQFHTRFVRVGALCLVGAALLGTASGVVAKLPTFIISGALASLTYAASYLLTFRGDGMLGRRLFIYCILFSAMGAAISSGTGPASLWGLAVSLTITLAGFVLARIDLVITSVVGAVMLITVVSQQIAKHGLRSESAPDLAMALALVAVQGVAITMFTAHTGRNQDKLHGYVDEVDRVMAHAERIAKGDLTGTVDGDSEVSRTIRTMLEGLRTMALRMREAAAALSSSAQESAAMARQQEQGAMAQASAVVQVHRTLAQLLEGSHQAAQSTDEVFRNVEATHRTSEVVAQRAAALSTHTRRISEILELIKTIANKSEILALNAALEGARAGEAGRGFSLVASQMQRLAESVMDSVRNVRAIIDDIESATSATLAATQESTQLATKATAAAREISLTLQEQRGGTEQVTAAMQDIQQVTTQVSAGTTQSLAATSDLTRLAGELKGVIDGFRL